MSPLTLVIGPGPLALRRVCRAGRGIEQTARRPPRRRRLHARGDAGHEGREVPELDHGAAGGTRVAHVARAGVVERHVGVDGGVQQPVVVAGRERSHEQVDVRDGVEVDPGARRPPP